MPYSEDRFRLLLDAAYECTGTTGPIPPGNWEWIGMQHRDGGCKCLTTQPATNNKQRNAHG